MSPRAATFVAMMLCALGVTSLIARGDEAFYSVPLNQLSLTGGKLPPSTQPDWRPYRRLNAISGYAAIEGAGEAILAPAAGDAEPRRQTMWTQPERLVLLIRVPEPRDLRGRLFLPRHDGSGMHAVRFEIPASHVNPQARQQFFRAQQRHYEDLLQKRYAGAAWFRHRAAEARRARGDQAEQPEDNRAREFQANSGGSDLAATYALFSGGRAVSENLSLDRELPTTEKQDRPTIDVSSINGITVTPMDFKTLLGDATPQLDPLAAYVPHDQHAVFFSNLDALTELIDESEMGLPALRMAEPRSEDAMTRRRYERQLGVPLDELAKLLGPLMIRSLAATGSDPYFRTGTDVALLFETANPEALRVALAARIELSRAAHGEDVQSSTQTIEDVEISVVRSRDRFISSYLATLGDAVVVLTNSPAQLHRIIRAHRDGQTLASLDEYRFFRNRYLRGDAQKNAFVMISDATIRRWCGPAWRIGASRRTRAAAIMSELQALHMSALASGELEAGPIHTERPHPDLGELRLTPGGVTSSVYGSLEFLTPIAELELLKVTEVERDNYNRWRNNYENNWRWAFDPIGARLTSNADRLEADVSIMPLIWRSEYRFFVDISRGASISQSAADLHRALAHFVVAINQESSSTRSYLNLARNFAMNIGPDPLAWMGPTVSFFIDDDARWREPVPAEPKPEQMTELPIGFIFENKDSLRLAAFLTAIRAMIDQTAPEMLVWESLKHGERPYVKISSREARAGVHFSVYYAPTSQALIVALSESTLKAALERRSDGSGQPVAHPAPATRPAQRFELLGENLALQVDRRMIDQALPHLEMSRDDVIATEMQLSAWSNLPILNEWKRLYPDQNPQDVHQRVWKTKLIGPDGSGYLWNEEYQTMESTSFGSPATPKMPAPEPRLLEGFEFFNFGITFEGDGLRGRVALHRERQ